MINNDSIINVETKNNRMNKMTKLIHSNLNLHYNISHLPTIII